MQRILVCFESATDGIDDHKSQTRAIKQGASAGYHKVLVYLRAGTVNYPGRRVYAVDSTEDAANCNAQLVAFPGQQLVRLAVVVISGCGIVFAVDGKETKMGFRDYTAPVPLLLLQGAALLEDCRVLSSSFNLLMACCQIKRAHSVRMC